MAAWSKRIVLSLAVLGVLAATGAQAQTGNGQGARPGPGETAGGGFRALSGAAAEAFVLPADVELVTSTRLARYGLSYERYQQVFGEARVLGGQITLYRDDDGVITSVIGAHYPDITPTNTVRLGAAEARGIAERDIGPEGERITELMIDPASGRYFFRVETRRPDSRWILWIGAETGRILNRYDALAHQGATCGSLADTPCGYGVEYDHGDSSDIKDLEVENLLAADSTFFLTSPPDEPYCPDGPFCLWAEPLTINGNTYRRQETYDQGSTNWPFLPNYTARDDDDMWVEPGHESPGQAALVDAHYYAYVTDQYLLNRHGYDWVAESVGAGEFDAMVVLAHYKEDYNNAFWNGSYVTFGDGDHVDYREFTSLDVVAHELAHGVTDFTSDLIYQDESGALNEAFSDILGAGAEWFADANALEPAGLAPDWLVGEDFDLRDDTVPGIRNMADPEEDGDPDHWDERYTGMDDNGGVHTNSGIPNHAFYLLVNGGQNASCASPTDHDSAHCTGFESPVAGIGLENAEAIFFLGFTALASDATMCQARFATEAVAGDYAQSTTEAWAAVGLTDAVCPEPGADNPPYDVRVTEPDDGATVSGKRVKLKAEAQDDHGVARFEFLLDDADASSDPNPQVICVDDDGSNGGSCRWDSKSVPDGDYQLSVRAWDTADQWTESDAVAITVANDGGSSSGNGGGGGGKWTCDDKPDHPSCS